MSGLGDTVVRDPFTDPTEFELDERMKAAFRALLPNLTEDSVVMVVSPGWRTQNVIGAKLMRGCAKCRRRVWVAPSSLKTFVAGAVAICSDCLGPELGAVIADVGIRTVRERFLKRGG